MNRIEYKYFVPLHRLADLRNAVMPFLDADINMFHGEGMEYTVRSIYFDSPELDFYHEKIAGLPIRKKLRIRAYNELHPKSPVFLEIKRKKYQCISKDRAMISFESVEDFLVSGQRDEPMSENGTAEQFEHSARRFLFHLYAQHLKPFTLVTYEREAYHGKFDPSFRLTFDKNLRFLPASSISVLFDDHEMIHAFPSLCIMEVKFYQSIPVWLTSLIGEFGLRREAISKYCISVERVYNHGGLKRMPKSSVQPR